VKLIMLGAHQRSTSLSILEHLTINQERLPHALHRLRDYVPEGMIISTCNRVEIYALANDATQGLRALQDFLLDYHGMSPRSSESPLSQYSEEAVVQHIFRLAAGLDSMVLGDDQIMGQIKSAYAASRQAGVAGKVVHRLVNRALACGKLVRTETHIASHPVSVVSVALDQAERYVGDLQSRHCLIVGAGHTADLALKLLTSKQCGRLGVINRTNERAARLAARYHAQAWPFNQMAQAMMENDVIICATTAPGFLISASLIEQSARATSRLFLDLSVPRGIDPAGVRTTNDHLVDMDILQVKSSENRGARAAELDHAEALIDPEVRAFLEWRAAESVVPTIRDLKSYAEQIRTAELQRALGRLSTLSPAEQQAIESLTAAIVNKLLHEPIMALKDPENGLEVAQALHRMFHFSSDTQPL
jgi:glutamyl-tRNA reductase